MCVICETLKTVQSTFPEELTRKELMVILAGIYVCYRGQPDLTDLAIDLREVFRQVLNAEEVTNAVH